MKIVNDLEMMMNCWHGDAWSMTFPAKTRHYLNTKSYPDPNIDSLFRHHIPFPAIFTFPLRYFSEFFLVVLNVCDLYSFSSL